MRPVQGTQAFIGDEDVAQLDDMAKVVQANHEPKLSLAVRRLVSAVTARFDPSDGLIDAVIALEALFAGTDKSELRFRIAAAVAWLLEPSDQSAREAIFKEARDIYDKRSQVVHGQAVPPNTPELRDRAFTLGVSSLRRLHLEFPSLLPDDQRSAKIILHTV